MASNTREANTDNERALLTSAWKKDVETLTSLLQKGVCPNVYHELVCWHGKKRERECKEEREEEEGGKMRERESLAHIFSSLIFTFFSGLGKFLSPSCHWMQWWCVKVGAFVCESVENVSIGERERRGMERCCHVNFVSPKSDVKWRVPCPEEKEM